MLANVQIGQIDASLVERPLVCSTKKKKKEKTNIHPVMFPKQGREQLLTHMAVFAHTTHKHNTTQQNTTQALDQLQDRHPQLSRSFVFVFFIYFFFPTRETAASLS